VKVALSMVNTFPWVVITYKIIIPKKNLNKKSIVRRIIRAVDLLYEYEKTLLKIPSLIEMTVLQEMV
jgi:hypothetical protein